MSSLRKVWYIALKDLKLFARDPAAVFFFIVFPFLFIILFNFLLSGVGGEDERLTLHLATRESAGISQEILAGLESIDEPGQPVFVWQKDYDAARQKVEDGDLAGFIAFPADFTRALLPAGPGTYLEIVVNADDVNTKAALEGAARAIAAQIGTSRIIVDASIELLSKNGVSQAAIEAVVQEIYAGLISAGLGGGESSYISFAAPQQVGEVEAQNPANFVIPGYLVMFVFFAAAMSAETIVRERKNNTLERLMSTSVSREVILSGTFTGIALRGLVQIIIFWVVGVLVFKVDLGLSPPGVFVLSFLMVIMSSAAALLLATIATTQRNAGALANITSLVLAPLGGCWWPFFLYPDWLQTIGRITPHAWATTGFNKLMVFGADFGAAVPEMVALLVFAAIFGVLAVWRFRTSAT